MAFNKDELRSKLKGEMRRFMTVSAAFSWVIHYILLPFTILFPLLKVGLAQSFLIVIEGISIQNFMIHSLIYIYGAQEGFKHLLFNDKYYEKCLKTTYEGSPAKLFSFTESVFKKKNQ